MTIKSIFSPQMKSTCLLPSLTIVLCLTISHVSLATIVKDGDFTKISRSYYAEKLQGFWLGQNIGNWTGLITEMDKVGTPETLPFYTDTDWAGCPLTRKSTSGGVTMLGKNYKTVVIDAGKCNIEFRRG